MNSPVLTEGLTPLYRPMRIGKYEIAPALALAPMAGVTDLPFRSLCRKLGAGIVVSEMTSADPSLWNTRKSKQRLDHSGESEPVSVQIAGYDADMLAHAAKYVVDNGAQIVDINMGCPAKKVCKRDAGSALMRDENLVRDICERVVAAVNVPVSLKIRTGWSRQGKNAVSIARIAEQAGIQALAVHGRTRDDVYKGHAEYDTIRAVKNAVRIPVWANGDITSPQKALEVLNYTGADGLMIGRGAQGNPWIFREIHAYLSSGTLIAAPSQQEVRDVLLNHVRALHQFYGEVGGVRIARKHIRWYCDGRQHVEAFWQQIARVTSAELQCALITRFFSGSFAMAA